jgi:hypothetical protein
VEIDEARPGTPETGQETAVEEHLPFWNYGDEDESDVLLADPKDLEEEEHEMESAVGTAASCKAETNAGPKPNWLCPESER